jgi:DNA-binding NtrC family response regulator
MNSDDLREINRRIAQTVEKLKTKFEREIEKIKEGARREHEASTARLATIWFGDKPVGFLEAMDLHISIALAKNEQNLSATARDLGMHRRTLQRIIKRKERQRKRRDKRRKR